MLLIPLYLCPVCAVLHPPLPPSLSPSLPTQASKLSDAKARAAADARARRAQADTERRSLVFKLREARRADRKLSAVNQFKQAMTAPDYELEDLDW